LGARTGTISFGQNETSKTITVAAVDDGIPEARGSAAEAFFIELSVGSAVSGFNGGIQVGPPLRVRVNDNDLATVVVDLPATAAEGNVVQLRAWQTVNSAPTINTMGVPVPEVPGEPVRIASVFLPRVPLQYRVAGVRDDQWRDHGALNPANSDPFPTGDGWLQLTDAAGAQHQSQRVTRYLGIAADDINEADRRMVVTTQVAPPGLAERVLLGSGHYGVTHRSTEALLTHIAGYAEQYVHTITVRDDDDITATFAAARLEVDEGQEVALAVNFDHISAGDITLAYTVTASGDLPPEFTDLTGGSIVIPAGERSGLIRLRANLSATRSAAAGELTVAFGDITPGAGAGRAAGVGEAVISVRYLQQARIQGVSRARAHGGGVFAADRPRAPLTKYPPSPPQTGRFCGR